MKIQTLSLMILALLLATPSIGQEPIDIAVLLPDRTTYRWSNDDQPLFEELLSETDFRYEIYLGDGIALTQQLQAEDAIERGAKIILLVNTDSMSGAEIIELARSQGVIVIDYDRLTIEGDGADYYVSFDNEAVGQLQGEGLITAIQSAQEAGQIESIPQVVMLNGSPTDNNATLFRNGAYNVIEPYFGDGDWDLLAETSVPNWSYGDALIIFQVMQDTFDDIDGVLAANDDLAQAVIDSLIAVDADFIPLTGQDATVGGLQNILAGRQSMTIYKSIRAEVEATVALTSAILEDDQDTISTLINEQTVNNGNNDIPAVLLTPLSVDVDNISETVIADGFRSWEEICIGEFEEFCPAGWEEVEETD